ncbi:MAG: lytic transglycosylase domain-containing protein [Candidatus Dormibacteria bacterium]
MNRRSRFWLMILSGGGILAWYLTRPQSGSTALTSDSLLTQGIAALNAVTTGWKNVGEGTKWADVFSNFEQELGLPTDLLARVAYQESHFRQDIIDGSKISPAGALGIMQLMPQYFKTVNVPRPYSDADTTAQIQEAAQQLLSLYNSTSSWPLAIAAYNAGLGNVQKYGGIPPFTETENYVAQVMADVPSLATA